MNLEASRIFAKNYNSKARIIINQGGTSSTKTYSILQVLLLKALQEQGALISVVAESLPHLKRGALRDFKTICKDIRHDYNKSDHIFRFGKSAIEFFSSDQPTRLRGGRRDYLFMNECNNQTKEAFDELEPRTRKQVYLDFNPTSEFWVHTDLLHLDDIEYIQSTYLDNPFLEERIIKSIESRKSTNPNWWRVMGLGEVGSNEGLIFRHFNLVDKIDEKATLIAYGLDFGFVNDPTALIGVYKHSGELFLKEFIYETDLHNSDIANKMKELGIKHHEEIICDSAEPKSIDWLRRAGFNTHPAKKGKDSIKAGIDNLLQYKINIEKTSTNIIREFRNYAWKTDKNGKPLNVPIDDFNHAIDGARYVALKKLLTDSKSWINY